MSPHDQDDDRSGRPAPRKERRTWRGTVVATSGADVFVELGPRLQGVAPLADFDEPPQPGEAFDFAVKGQEEGLWLLSRSEARHLSSWKELQPGALVKAKVTGQNTGGLELRIGPLAAFMPASQVALRREEDLAQFLGQTFECEVVESDPERKRVVLSRRAVLERDRADARVKSVGSLSTGQVVKGKVTRVEAFGAFVDLGGGLEGLLHVSNIAHRRVENPAELLAVGQELSVKVLEISEGGKRVGLGLKQLQPDPWQEAAERLSVGQVLRGKVTRLADFGAFVELFPGVEGLLHVSQIGANQRVRRPKDLLAVGQELDLRILAVEPVQKRISLSRLDARGALLGSEDAAEAGAIDAVLREAPPQGIATNLGSLFRRALDPGGS